MVYLGDVMFLMGWVSILLYFIKKKENILNFWLKKLGVYECVFLYILNDLKN